MHKQKEIDPARNVLLYIKSLEDKLLEINKLCNRFYVQNENENKYEINPILPDNLARTIQIIKHMTQESEV